MCGENFAEDLLNASPLGSFDGFDDDACRRPADDTYTDGLDESETKNGVREELTTERGVTGDTLEESSENQSNTDSSALIRKS